MPARGIIGRKPTTTGLTSYSDVFGPDTQFTQQSVGTWPSGAVDQGNAAFVQFEVSGTLPFFRSFRKLSDGFYYQEPPVDAHPPISPYYQYWGTVVNGVQFNCVDACKKYVAVMSGGSGISSTTDYFKVYVWKRMSNYISPYKFIGVAPITGSNYFSTRPEFIKFNKDGTKLGVMTAAGDTAGTRYFPMFRVFSINQTTDTFTDIGVPDVLSSYPSSQLHSYGGCAWNDQGTSVVVSINYTPYIIIYNISGNTFTKLPTLPSLPATGLTSSGLQLAWSPDGTSLAIGYDDTGTGITHVLIYNRSGDTFSLATTLSDPSGDFTNAAVIRQISWHPSGNLLAVTAGYLRVYSRSGNTFTSLSLPNSLYNSTSPTMTAISAQFLSNGTELLVHYGNTPRALEILDVNGTSITRASTLKMATSNNTGFAGTAGSGYAGNATATGTSVGVGTGLLNSGLYYLFGF